MIFAGLKSISIMVSMKLTQGFFNREAHKVFAKHTKLNQYISNL